MNSLDSKIISFIESGKNDSVIFNQLAEELFELQKEKVDLYKLSPLPTSAFKLGRVSTFPPQETVTTFFTSGTTEVDRGKHEFDTLKLIETSYLQGFKMLVGFSSSYFLSLIPPRHEAPDSSLAHMVDFFSKEYGKKGTTYAVQDGKISTDIAIS